MEDEQESEAEEDNHGDGESEAEGETEAESEFDPEIEMEAERVAQRRCPDHGLDLSTYCQEDTQLICVLCPVIGAHQGHQLSTLDEAFEELRSKDSGGLKAAMIELVERLKFKSSDPKVTRDQMKVFIQQEFKKVQKVIADEEQKALHLVDIQEAMATAHVTEILADIQSHMDRLMTQMAQAKEQLDTSNEAAEPKAEGDEEGLRCSGGSALFYPSDKNQVKLTKLLSRCGSVVEHRPMNQEWGFWDLVDPAGWLYPLIKFGLFQVAVTVIEEQGILFGLVVVVVVVMVVQMLYSSNKDILFELKPRPHVASQFTQNSVTHEASFPTSGIRTRHVEEELVHLGAHCCIWLLQYYILMQKTKEAPLATSTPDECPKQVAPPEGEEGGELGNLTAIPAQLPTSCAALDRATRCSTYS
ncbi:Tripartite motif-containing protein 44 [Myotis davidii]|uniref:Tripartite motif-containing protein 44 n=1 Tax=Myotis davidii TaxID=225400 RepID=L5MCI2_MYODS|nr:Tripartite motif-containing protein 44 [Myotis davidii]